MTESEECQSHLRELREWLRVHQPKPYWSPEQHQARRDRQAALDRWIAVATRIAKGEVK